MKALIDADIFQWEFGNATDDEGTPLSWPFIQARVQGRINGILEATGADEYQCYLTSDDKSNFRYSVATIKPYKGNRQGIEKPRYYNHIRNFLKDHRGAIEVHGMEADDALSIEQYGQLGYITVNGEQEIRMEVSDTVICSRDKDLNMVPGWHYSWGAGKCKEKEVWWQDEIEGLKSFYQQLLTGDSVDNIPGLYGVGKSSSYVKHISTLTSEFAMYGYVLDLYKQRFGSYADQFLVENARLLWMLREEGEVWTPPTEEKES